MPASIKLFERLYLFTLAIGVVLAVMQFGQLTEMLSVDFVLMIQVFTFGLLLALVLLVSRKRSRVAKWILLAMFGIGTVIYLTQLPMTLDTGFPGVASAIQTLLQLVALCSLFTRESRDWLSRKPSIDDAPEVEVFR